MTDITGKLMSGDNVIATVKNGIITDYDELLLPLAPIVGLEPTTLRLTAACSTIRSIYIPERLVSGFYFFIPI